MSCVMKWLEQDLIMYLHIINNPLVPHWSGNALVELPDGCGEIQLVDGQAVYIEGASVRLI